MPDSISIDPSEDYLLMDGDRRVNIIVYIDMTIVKRVHNCHRLFIEDILPWQQSMGTAS
jgi:hypothetical protein